MTALPWILLVLTYLVGLLPVYVLFRDYPTRPSGPTALDLLCALTWPVAIPVGLAVVEVVSEWREWRRER